MALTQQQIEQAYQNVFHGPSDPTGMSEYLKPGYSNWTQQQLENIFRQSPEYTSGVYMQPGGRGYGYYSQQNPTQNNQNYGVQYPPVPEIPTAPTFTPSNYNISVPSVIDSSMLSSQFGLGDVTARQQQMQQYQTQYQDYLTQMKQYQQQILGLIQPSAAETSAQNAYQGAVAGIKQFDQSTQAGLNKIEGQAIPLGLVTGQQAELNRQAAVTRQGLVNEAELYSTQLANAYNARQTSLEGAKAGAGFAENDLVRVTGLEDDLRQLDKEDRNRANTILETILNATNGARYDDLSAQDKSALTALAQYTGLPISMIARGMDTAAQSLSSENYQTQLSNYYDQLGAYNTAQNQQSNAYKYFEDEGGNVVQYNEMTGEQKPLGGIGSATKWSTGGGGNITPTPITPTPQSTGLPQDVIDNFYTAQGSTRLYDQLAIKILLGELGYQEAFNQLPAYATQSGLNKALEAIQGNVPLGTYTPDQFKKLSQ